MGTYTLTETVAPIEQGYVRAESVTFEVGPTENIQRVEMKDDFTKVEIFKADMTDGHGNSESHDVRCPGALADPHET